MNPSSMNRWTLGGGVVLCGALGWSLWVQPWTLQSVQSGSSGGTGGEEKLELGLRPPPAVALRESGIGLPPLDRSLGPDRPEGAAGAEGSGEMAVWLQKGREALEKKDFGKAREVYEQALGRDGQDRRVLSALAWLEQRERNWGRSEELLRRALRQGVEDPALWLSLGVALMEQEKWEGATAAFCQAVSLEPKNARARRLLAVTLGRRGWMDGAEQEFRRAIELEPEDGGAHYNLALLYLERNPPLLELGRRHYYRALDLGVAADPAVALKVDGSAETKRAAKRDAQGESRGGAKAPVSR